LSKQYAFQPDLSDITRLAGSIAVSIRHQIDTSELPDKEANALSLAHQIISDAADYFKHGNLRDKERNSPITVAAAFEYRDDKTFSFIRNIATINHNSLGQHDFMLTSSSAAKFWMSHHNLSINWSGEIIIAPHKYEEVAWLKFNPDLCINMSSAQCRFFKMTDDNELALYNPPNVRFEIYE